MNQHTSKKAIMAQQLLKARLGRKLIVLFNIRHWSTLAILHFIVYGTSQLGDHCLIHLILYVINCNSTVIRCWS